MSKDVLYDVEVMTEAAQQARDLQKQVEESQERFQSLKTQLNLALSNVDMIGPIFSVNKKGLEQQSEQMERLEKLLNTAAEKASGSDEFIKSHLDFLLLLLVSPFDAVIQPAASTISTAATAISQVFGNLPVVGAMFKTPIDKLLNDPQYGSTVASLREYGLSDKQIVDLAKQGDLEILKNALHQAILDRAVAQTGDILNDKTIAVGAEKYQYLPGKQINCKWLARQRISAILGIKDYSKERGDIGFSEWKKFDGKSFNGYQVDYESVSAGTTMEDLISTLETKQPCAAMIGFSGHNLTVDRIENGIVYFTDNFTSGGVEPCYKTDLPPMEYDGTWGNRPYTGQIAYASLENFAHYVDSCCNGAITAYATFTKNP